MVKFTQLLIHEMNRAKKFYLSLVASVIGIELIIILKQVWEYVRASSNPILYANMPSIHYGYIFSQNVALSMVIGAAIAAMKLYSMYTWIREWRLQGNFIYRLLLLPGKRVTIAYAKLASVMLMIFGLLSVQVVFVRLVDLGLQHLFSQTPVITRAAPYYILTGSPLDVIMFPSQLPTFLLVYTIGFGCLAWIANLLIGYFSFRSKGLATTIGKLALYSFISVSVIVLFIALLIGVIWIGTELAWAYGIFAMIWVGGHLSFMHYLMKHAISI